MPSRPRYLKYAEKSKNYEHLFNTALSIAVHERPFTYFKELIDVQKRNGVKFFEGKDSDKSCKEFIKYIAEAVREFIKKILANANFLAGEMDASMARKTGDEKELVYVKVVVRGDPTELLLKVQKMSQF